MNEYTDIEAQVEYGLEKVDGNRMVAVNLRDLLYVHNTISEFVRFFHQPEHYRSLEDVEHFLGNSEKGGFHLLMESLHKRFQYREIFPEDIRQMIDDSEFENPCPPYYYKP